MGMVKLLRFRHWASAPPAYWRRITGPAGLRSAAQKRDWQLVLDSRSIPFRVCIAGKREHIYVPALLEAMARHELELYRQENSLVEIEPPEQPLHPYWQLAPVFLLPLVWWHGCQLGWWNVPAWLPAPSGWRDIGYLDAVDVLARFQWWRVFTSLTLHSDLPHIGGNVFFGAIFIALLARLAGVGRAWLIAVAGGALGNCASLLVHNWAYASVGFSTALFAAVGGIAGIRLAHSSRKFLIPLGAGLALLALLGTEGANTDYGAHICGLGCGFIFGLVFGWRQKRRLWLPPQLFSGFTAFMLPVFAWILAFRHALS